MTKRYKFSFPETGACCFHKFTNAEYTSEKFTVIKEEIHIDLVNKTVTIPVKNIQCSKDEVIKSLQDDFEDLGEEGIFISLDDDHTEIQEIQNTSFRSHLWKGIIGILSGSALLGLCVSGIAIPLTVMYALAATSTLLSLYLGKDTYYKAAKALKNKSLTMDTLFSISTIVALGVSIFSLAFPWLPMMYDAALLIFGFKHIGKAVEASVNSKIDKSLNFRSRAPKKILCQSTATGQFQKTLVRNLLPGDLIIVRRGEVVPVDGECESQNAAVYNKIVTGRTLPQQLKKSDVVYAGSIVDVDELYIRVKKREENSYLAQLDHCIQADGKTAIEAPIAQSNEKAALEVLANKIMKYFIPTVLTLAFVSAIVIGTLLSPLTAIQCAIAILVSACPCTFGLIIPIAIKIGIVKAAADGLRFMNGKALQDAGEIDTVVLDLNGTLTEGQPQVKASNIPLDMLDHLLAIEQQSAHPFAKAICQYIRQSRKKNLSQSRLLLNSHLASPGGVEAGIDGESFAVGSKSMMLSRGFTEEEIKAVRIKDKNKDKEAQHIVYFARGQKLLGCILLHDPLRKDAQATIHALKSMNKKIHLCTGADKDTADKYAKALGLENIERIAAVCIGPAKEQYIDGLIREGRKVTMIGDAANDVAAIRKSTLGIAIESDDAIVQQEANAIIRKTNHELSLWPIITALTIGKQTVAHIKQNLALSLSYNMLTFITLGCLFCCLGIIINPAIGAALMFLQSGLILANTYRFKNKKLAYANDASYLPTPQSTLAIHQGLDLRPEEEEKVDETISSELNKGLPHPPQLQREPLPINHHPPQLRKAL